ncbi:hypothetical protein [Bordetella genomosp. 11]|uniref:hypothetical protein n=1 Tax=Bordetella genomosp. 11 TaxID=1416808 RepID=UPI001140038C|nr:hypothetical protein [Bordetella genomosp. 11]
MQTSDTPSLIPVPFSNSGTKNSIPTSASPTPGLASLETGFPPATMTPIVAGGIPPAGADFNGILFLISAVSRWANAGGSYGYDSTFASSIGGYPKGSVLLNAAANGFWMSTADNNTNDPDASGANWINPLSGRLLGVQIFTANGTYTPGTYNGVTAKTVWVKMCGGGGAGGGVQATGASAAAAACGGNAGSYSEWIGPAATQTITIGAGGAAGAAGFVKGGDGGQTSFGASVTIQGGAGGQPGGAGAPPYINIQQQANGGGTLGALAGGTRIVNQAGMTGGYGLVVSSAGPSGGVGGQIGGIGGSTPFGTQTYGATPAAFLYGNGGGGASGSASIAASAGFVGRQGVVVILEFA